MNKIPNRKIVFLIALCAWCIESTAAQFGSRNLKPVKAADVFVAVGNEGNAPLLRPEHDKSPFEFFMDRERERLEADCGKPGYEKRKEEFVRVQQLFDFMAGKVTLEDDGYDSSDSIEE